MAASFLLLLTSVGLFLSAQAQDCSKPVGGDNMDLKGDDILLQTFPDGIKVTFACNVGYQSVGGSASITCTAAAWSPLRMTCERKSCGAIGDVPNGQVDYSEGIQFGDKLTVTCDPGYDLFGNPIIQCGSEGWMGRLPVCEVKHCDPPVDPTIGSFYPVKETYEYREVIQFSCPEPFTLNGSKSLSCSETGVFQPAAPKCVQVECKEPVVKFGHWDSGSRGPYTYKTTVMFKCNEGYRMTNSATIICGINSQWEPELPKCEPVECEEPVVKFGHWDSGSQGPYTYKTTVTFKCNEGYKMTNSATIICGSNSQWGPELPKCEAVPAVQTTTTKSPESTTAVPAVQTTTTKSPEATKKPTAPDPNGGGESLSTGVALGVVLAANGLMLLVHNYWM
ncbi:hypothetical protein OYC64_014113 [Pagothenia borchgrevinki]|uniref:Sushi domain-containing protein n=1 Tax=Pagothenia borchgrevinki TaxID=8213 RepID=A0ABD2H0G6_PAGBO